MITPRETYLEKLRQFMDEHGAEYGITRMGIFGSVARGEHTEQSDVDVYYEGPSMGLKSFGIDIELEKMFGVPVDVVRKHNGLRPTFLNRIMRDMLYV